MVFFENPTQLDMHHDKRNQLQSEEVSITGDLVDVDGDNIITISDTLRNPRGRIPDSNPKADAEPTTSTPAFVFCAKSQKIMDTDCDLVQ